MNRKIAVLVSGEGSNLHSLWAYNRRDPEARLDICVVIADRDCKALHWARSIGIPTVLVERYSKGLHNRDEYTCRLVDTLEPYNPALVVMAGFMTMLEVGIFEQYPRRVLNMHPSLLPELRGKDAVEQAYKERGTRRRSGCTLHVAGPVVDTGDIIAQKEVPLLIDDSLESFRKRIKTVEHGLYPPAVSRYLVELP